MGQSITIFPWHTPDLIHRQLVKGGKEGRIIPGPIGRFILELEAYRRPIIYVRRQATGRKLDLAFPNCSHWGGTSASDFRRSKLNKKTIRDPKSSWVNLDLRGEGWRIRTIIITIYRIFIVHRIVKRNSFIGKKFNFDRITGGTYFVGAITIFEY